MIGEEFRIEVSQVTGSVSKRNVLRDDYLRWLQM